MATMTELGLQPALAFISGGGKVMREEGDRFMQREEMHGRP